MSPFSERTQSSLDSLEWATNASLSPCAESTGMPPASPVASNRNFSGGEISEWSEIGTLEGVAQRYATKPESAINARARAIKPALQALMNCGPDFEVSPGRASAAQPRFIATSCAV